VLFTSVALACAALIGFAARRASLCNVRAVAEVMISGSAHMLLSPLQAVLWMATLTGVMTLVLGIAPQPAWPPSMSDAAVASYLSMLVGIALVLAALRAVRVPMPVVACSPAGCDEAGAATPIRHATKGIRQGETS
jgi:hypothetical protein